MGRESGSWKTVVVALAAVLGVALGFDGARAPRLHSAISRIGETHAAGPAGQPPAATGRPTAPASPPRARQAAPASPPPARQAAPASPPPAPAGAAPAPPAPGPLLSETRYGAYAYQVYPAASSPDTDRALTGFRLAFRRVTASTVEVTVADLQDGTTQTATFSAANRLYFIETRMGDDGMDGETNLGDDGFILTDADGHILNQ